MKKFSKLLGLSIHSLFLMLAHIISPTEFKKAALSIHLKSSIVFLFIIVPVTFI